MSSIYEGLHYDAERMADRIRSVVERVRELREKVAPVRPSRCRFTRFIGVDGGLSLYTGSVLSVGVVKAAAVVIEARNGGLRITSVEKHGPMYFTLPTPYDSLEVRTALEEVMSYYETLMLEKLREHVDSETLVVIDGPLSDPPRVVPLSPLTPQLVRDENLLDYHHWRASIIRDLARRGGIAGYVKRPSGIKWLSAELGVDVEDSIVAKVTLREGEYTRPRPAPISQPPLEAYTDMYYSYVKASRGNIARIDSIGALGAANAAECLLLIPAAIHPLPVTAAHEAARLRASDAEKLHRILLSALLRRLGRDSLKLLTID